MVDYILVQPNYKVANLTFQVHNDGVHESLISASCEFYQDIEKMMLHIKVNFPDNPADSDFSREFMKTSVDVRKILEGAGGNFLVRSFMENIYKSVDFDLKFPVKKVSAMKFQSNFL